MNILVVSTSEYLTLRLLKCLAPLGVSVHILGTERGAALRASRYCRRYHAAPPEGVTSALIETLCRRHGIDVILPSGMDAGFLLARLKGEDLGAPTLPLAGPEQLETLHNKWTFSRLLSQAGLPQPATRLLQTAEDAAVLDLPFPVIVKPLELDAGRGVTRCDSPEQLVSHVQHERAHLPLLAQEFIPGTDIGLGLLTQNGRVLASSLQKQNSDGGGVEFLEHPEALEVGRRIVALTVHDGIAHFDMRLDERDGSVKVLECNPRFWASLPFCMLAGVNFAQLGIQRALGRDVTPVQARPLRLTFPSRALSGALRGRAVSGPSRSALGFTLADPLPQVVLGANRLGSSIATLFRHSEERLSP